MRLFRRSGNGLMKGRSQYSAGGRRRRRRADAYFEKAAKQILEKHGIRERTDRGGICSVGIAAEILKQEDSIVRQYVIRQMIGETYQSLKDITSVHVEGG